MKKLWETLGTVVGIVYAAILVVIVAMLPLDIAIWSIQWFMRLIGVGV
jgi:hypothetical protein